MISYCITNLGRKSMIGELVRSINAQTDRRFEIVITNYDDEDFAFGNCRVVKCNGRFSRSIGLNKAAELAKGDILVFLDADMFIPPNFSDYISKRVTPGTCCFPVCFSLHKDKPRITGGSMGWWRWEGSGNCAFTASDFRRLKWNEARFSRGGEDTEFLVRSKKTLRVIREPVDGFFHRWHPAAKVIGGVLIFTTSKCNAGCPFCSQLATRRSFPNYSCSIDELHRFLEVMRESFYVSSGFMLGGGEPSLWENLVQASALLRNCDLAKQLLMFSNGADVEKLIEVCDMFDQIRLSRYSWNGKQIDTLLKRGRNFVVVDKFAHIDISPRKIHRSVAPVKCNCMSYGLFNGFIHTCDNAKNLESIYRTGTPHKIPLQPFFLSKLPPRINALCSVCWGNLTAKDGRSVPSSGGKSS